MAIVASGLAVSTTLAQTVADAAITRAVIFVYNRFGEDAYSGTSIRLDQFNSHLDELNAGGYTVLPVPQIIEAITAHHPLQESTIGITIDQPYRSVYTIAWPRLRQARVPFTLFVSSDSVDLGRGDTMSWAELRELARDPLVTIGSEGASYAHLANEDRAYVLGQIQRSADRIRTELGVTPSLFAHPYGEWNASVIGLLRQSGYRAAFGQHSGVAHSREDPFALPRFPMNDTHGSIERFRLAAEALPLVVTDITPDPPVGVGNPPVFGFTVDPQMGDLSALSCFASGLDAPPWPISARVGSRSDSTRSCHPVVCASTARCQRRMGDAGGGSVLSSPCPKNSEQDRLYSNWRAGDPARCN